ncbi:Zn-ribbon domain-containing OB-fold protein [Halobacterium sp. KA-4]|jgi:uncharacterized OB-fold protein|uniref:Zn-ribbon domain-containing OB-fold protein n=1 Tax=Halobacterium sp. KA-4 TaxID=2896367 RepID=UPI001E2DE998|nr:Zn-ribbon domain-containing OB-fold protein [Halobacterium sp. KA-4]MCD2198344.1 Zn-ribbon domain-containing OB-fold protein [Halobacterium sp. KA-4]
MTEDDEPVRDAGFDEFLDALADGEGYYVECANGHGSLPPRRVCPECGSADLDETPLPDSGEVATYTRVHVPAPSFADDAPYVTAVVDFGPVRLTGQVQADVEDVEIGLDVEPGFGETETRGERLVVFEPR